MAVVIQCPSCQRRVSVPDTLLGKRVKCPKCKESFTASETGIQPEKPKKATASPVAAPPKLPPKPPKEEVVDDEPLIEPEADEDAAPAKPRRRRRVDEDEDDDDDDRGRTKRRRRRDDDEDNDFEERLRRRPAPHRGGLVLTLGIVTLVVWCCPLAGFIVGGIAANLAKNDLAAMAAGRMDESGRGLTMAGNVCAIIGVVLSLINFIVGVIWRATGHALW
jgi:predicted Zn finger-like uncharacterized protein